MTSLTRREMLAVPLAAAACGSGTPERRPNMLLAYTDDQS